MKRIDAAFCAEIVLGHAGIELVQRQRVCTLEHGEAIQIRRRGHRAAQTAG